MDRAACERVGVVGSIAARRQHGSECLLPRGSAAAVRCAPCVPAAVPGCVASSGQLRTAAACLSCKHAAAVFASPGLSGCPPDGWAARGAPELHLGVRQPLERDPAPFQPICPPSTHTCPCSQVAIGMSRRCFGWVLQLCARFQTIVGIRELAAPPAPRAGDPGGGRSRDVHEVILIN